MYLRRLKAILSCYVRRYAVNTKYHTEYWIVRSIPVFTIITSHVSNLLFGCPWTLFKNYCSVAGYNILLLLIFINLRRFDSRTRPILENAPFRVPPTCYYMLRAIWVISDFADGSMWRCLCCSAQRKNVITKQWFVFSFLNAIIISSLQATIASTSR